MEQQHHIVDDRGAITLLQSFMTSQGLPFLPTDAAGDLENVVSRNFDLLSEQHFQQLISLAMEQIQTIPAWERVIDALNKESIS